MKLRGSSSTQLVAAMLTLAVAVGAFWILLLSPKREEAQRLGAEADGLRVSLAQSRAEVAEAEVARSEFPADYRRLVVLGKAVPGGNDTASLLVQVNRIAEEANGTFRDLALTASGGGEATAPPVEAGGVPVSATEAAASLLPLGASIGPAGLAVMPYEITFDGNFFDVADFIAGLDSMVKTGQDEVNVDGRLVTIDGFSLEAAPGSGFPDLEASFAITTYLTPPGEGVAGNIAPPGLDRAAPASMTTGGER